MKTHLAVLLWLGVMTLGTVAIVTNNVSTTESPHTVTYDAHGNNSAHSNHSDTGIFFSVVFI